MSNLYGSLYRHVLLPTFDRFIKGRRTLSHWKFYEESQWWPREKLEAFQLDSLRVLLRHAEETCPYYAERFRALGLTGGTLQSLADFARWPLLTRDDIAAHRAKLRSTAKLKLITKATGGSTGVPLQFDLDTDSHDRRTAVMYRGYGWAGGAPGTKQLFIWGGPLSTLPWWKQLKQQLHALFENHLVLNCFEFTEARMAEHFHTLDRYRPDVIVAYTNAVYEFARYLDSLHLKPYSPGSIIVGAEKLHGFQRELLERVFRCPVFETYGSREVMMIGGECEKHEGLHVSSDNLLVEILDDDGQPTPDGVEGNVVVTDLFNHGMPFIRYVNGDRAVAGFKTCSCGRGLPLMGQVTGRRLDVLRTPDGRRIPGEFFPHLIKDFAAVRRFQVEQPDLSRIVLRLVAPDLSAAQRAKLEQAVRDVIGFGVQLEVHSVDDIPLTNAGKHKVVVSRLGDERDLPVTATATATTCTMENSSRHHTVEST